MKKLQMIVYLILLLVIGIGFGNGFDKAKIESQDCVAYFHADFSYYNEQLFWKEDGKCCKYALIDNQIKQYCENE